MPTQTPIPRERRRVIVTGLGLVTPLGSSPEEIHRRLAGGETAARQSVPGTSLLRSAPVPDFAARSFFRQPKALKLTDRKTQLAVAAATLAVSDAGLAGTEDRDEWAIVLGCSASDLQVEELTRALGAAAPGRAVDDVPFFARRVLAGLNPLWLLITLPNMVGAHVGIQLGSHGPNHTVTGDWIAGTQALGEAFLAIAGGEREVAIAGGADAPLDPYDLGCLASHPRLGETASATRPLTLAEGAAVWVLEERTHALRRGARMLGEVCGYASGAAVHGDVQGAVRRTVALALAESGWTTDDLAAVARAGGGGHPWEDAERSALDELFATSRADEDPDSARRELAFGPLLGHAVAASGAIDGALLLKSLASSADHASGRGLLLSLGTVGQCAALALATAVDS